MPTLPFRGEPIITCPVTGLQLHLSEAVPRRGSWVHPDAADERHYKEPPEPPISLHPLMRRPRRWRQRDR